MSEVEPLTDSHIKVGQAISGWQGFRAALAASLATRQPKP
jgi:hypothetical protein